MKLYGILIALLPLTLTAACGSDDDDEGSSVPLEDLPPIYAEALCQAFTNCAGQLFEIYLVGEDCVANTTTRVEEDIPAFQQAVDDGRIEYHGDQISACAAEIRGRACDDFQERGSGPCEGVLVGTVALGESCSLDEECVGSAFCDFGATCPGTCRELAAEGDACNEDDDCASGLVCSDSSLTCEEPAGPGDLCGGGNPACTLGYLCAGENADMNEPGNCRTYDEVLSGGDGDACNPLEGELCTTDLTCQVDAFLPALEASCAPNVGSGDACRLAFPDQCPDDEFCDIPTGTIDMPVMLEGTCRPRPGDGDPCGGTDSNICAANTRCNSGTCKDLTRLGGGCMVDEVCYSERCAEGNCVSASCSEE